MMKQHIKITKNFGNLSCPGLYTICRFSHANVNVFTFSKTPHIHNLRLLAFILLQNYKRPLLITFK